MKNYVQPGNSITVPAPTGGVVSGQPVAIGSLVGFAAADAAAGDDVAVSRVGVFDVTKESGAAWAVGDKVYLKAATTDTFNKTASGNTLFGFATAAAASGDTTGEICIDATL